MKLLSEEAKKSPYLQGDEAVKDAMRPDKKEGLP